MTGLCKQCRFSDRVEMTALTVQLNHKVHFVIFDYVFIHINTSSNFIYF